MIASQWNSCSRDISLRRMQFQYKNFRGEDFTRNSSSRRLLKLWLTYGHSEVATVEYSHIPAIRDDVVPGTKVFSSID
ncbi:hypothetical protein FF2_025822 [Malus domestica]